MIESSVIDTSAAGWLAPSVALSQPFVFADEVAPDDGAAAHGADHAANPAANPAAIAGSAAADQASTAVARPAPARRGAAATAQAHAAALIDRQGYHIGNVGLLARFDSASELTEMLPLAALPGAPSWVKGVANLHGNVVPVLDLAVLLGVAHDASKTPMLLVLGHGEAAAAVVIDGLPQRRRFKPADRIDLPVTIPALDGYVQAVYLESVASGTSPETRTESHSAGNLTAAPVWLDFDHLRFLDDLSHKAA